MSEPVSELTSSNPTTAPGATTPTDRTAGAAIVHQLEALGVRRAYGVPGESYLEVLDALHDSPVEFVVCRHEGGAGFMALAEARLTGVPGVVLVTRGPGAANAAIAVHTAWQDATPLVLLVGLVPVADRDRESFQEFSLTGWFGSTAKRVLTVETPDRAAEQLAEAFAVAGSGRPGPVVIGLPEDVLVQRTSRPVAPVRPVAAGAVSATQLAELGTLLDVAGRPLVIAAGDRWSAAASRALTEWCEHAGLPVATDWRSQDLVDHASPAYVGWLGYGCDPVLADALDRADLLLFVGGGYGDVLSGGYTGGHPDAVTVVVDPDPELRGHHRRVDLHLLADPAAFGAALAGSGLAAISRGGAGEPDPDWTKRLRAAQRRFSTPRGTAGADTGRGVDLEVAMALLAERLAPDAVITYGAGNHALWAQRFLAHHQVGTLLAPRNGAMGFGVPAAVAASLAYPGRQVVSLAGDGCFLMNGQELATAMAY
ncbi:MAG TPA: thiamine pyrophosphate-binding protein, partial [Pseudonocardia sp.]|nr:thiamine pyrophosphate-binding protein [Pseudonocardia sp.]